LEEALDLSSDRILNEYIYRGPELRYIFWPPLAQLRAHIVKLCRALSEDLCQKVVTNARVRLQEVVRQNGGHIEHVLH